MKTAALIGVFVVLLGYGLVVLWRFAPWRGGGADSPHMWVAMGLGVVVSLALGVGLMRLSFHSNAHGYDDAASHDD